MTTNRAAIRHGMIIIDAHGTYVGTVDHVEGERIKMTRIDSLDGVHHFIPMELVADIEGDKVRLSATAANAQYFED